MKPSEEQGMFQFLLFVSDIYIAAWFQAPLAIKAPANGLHFLNRIAHYSVNPVVQKAALTAFSRHLWYLSEVIVGMAFFDSAVDPKQKAQMPVNMQEEKGT